MTQLTLEHIEQEMAGTLVPGHVANFRVYLAAMYSLHAGEMQKILNIKAGVWRAMRETKNSDKATDREWQASE